MKERIKVHLYNRTIKEIELSDYSYISEDIFSNRSDIVKVEFPEGVEVIGSHAFESCVNLEEVVCPESLKRVGEEAFADCINLRKVSNISGAEVAPTAFKGCYNM